MSREIERRRLDELGDLVRTEVAAAEADFQSAVQHAIRAGEALIEAKGLVKHGEWLPWLRDHFPLSERTARNYMRLAEKSATVADLPTIREAIALLAAAKDEPAPLISAPENEVERIAAEIRELNEAYERFGPEVAAWLSLRRSRARLAILSDGGLSLKEER